MFDEVLTFWFGTLDDDGHADAAHQRAWFTKDPAFDHQIRVRFGALHAAASAGEHREEAETPRGAVALLVVLDQFSRNLHRDGAAAFANDPAARAIAERSIAAGFDVAVPFAMRSSFYLPLMHAEDLDAQRRCVALYQAWLEGSTSTRDVAALEATLPFAHRHAEIIERFGRFPHRNAALGRETTAAEAAFLREPNSGF